MREGRNIAGFNSGRGRDAVFWCRLNLRFKPATQIKKGLAPLLVISCIDHFYRPLYHRT
jgi:hypothetical protein